eukprot:2834981-Amphidinium_carterae.1
MVGPLQQWQRPESSDNGEEGLTERWGKWARQVMKYLHEAWPEMGKPTKASLSRGEGPRYRVMAIKEALQGQSYKDASECTRGWVKFQVQLKAAQRDKRPLPDRAWKKTHEAVPALRAGQITWTLPALAAAWNTGVDHWRSHVAELVVWQLKKSQRKDYARRKAGWKKFCQECLTQGGKEGYRYLRKKGEVYVQAMTEGGMPVGGSEGMKQLAKPWLKLWEVHGQDPADIYTTDEPLPTLTREDFEKAVRTAPLKAAGFDAMPTAMLKCLPAEAVTELWQMVTDWEHNGIPASQWVNVFALLPKTETQTRPIALTAMVLRIWARARSIKHQGAFQEVNAQFHGGTAELQCETLTAQHCLSTEAAQGLDGYETIQIYLDLTKAYEYVSHKVMVGEASKESQLLGRLALQSARSYAVQRAVTFNGLATQPVRTCGSILPGCAMATHFMKLVLKPLLQRVESALDLATIGNVVDDVSLQVFGPVQDVVRQAISGHDQLVDGITELQLKVNDKKTYVVGSSTNVVAEVYAHLAVKAEAKYTKFLGVLRSGGKRRRTSVQGLRTTEMNRRLQKLKWLRRGGAKTTNVKNAARASPVAAGLYGVAIQGVAPGQSPVGPVTGQMPQNGTQKLSSHPRTSEYRIGAALVTQGHRFLKATSPWASATGPASAILLLAMRLGFEITLQGDIKWGNEVIEVRKVGAQELKHFSRRLTEHWTLREAAKGAEILGDGAKECQEFAAQLPPFERSVIVNVWSGANWNMKKLFDKGLVEDDRCCICGLRGTQMHRLLECPAGDVLRHRLLGPLGRQALRKLAAESERCVEHMLPPASWFQQEPVPVGHRTKCERSLAATRHIFTDGAAVHPKSATLRMAAWAAVFSVDNDGWEVMSGRVPTTAAYRQTAFEGELLGVVHAAMHSQGPVAIHCDNQAVVLGAQKVLAGHRRRGKERHPELWDLLENANRPGLSVLKVKAHQKEPDMLDPSWYLWQGNSLADLEAGRALMLEGEAADCRKQFEQLVAGLNQIWRLHVAIQVQQNETGISDFLVDAILPVAASGEQGGAEHVRGHRKATITSRPDYPKWLQDIVLEGMTTLPGLCLGQKKRGVAGKKSCNIGRGRQLDVVVRLPPGSFLGEGHEIRSFCHAVNGFEIGLVCMKCGAYSTGHWGLLKHPC